MREQRVEHADYSFSVDTETGALRRLSLSHGCVVYRIVSALRDEHWGTPRPRTTLSTAGGHFVFAHDYRAAGYGLTGSTTIDHDAAGVRITWEASAFEPFLRNRLGLSLLLPGTLAGTSLEVAHPGGDSDTRPLPRLVEPQQPFTDIAALSFVENGTSVRIAFSGEVFEMEDQRNWTDFSFKVYGTPLALPFPVGLEPGDRLEQSISIEVRPAGDACPPAAAPDPARGTTADCAQTRMPAVGTRVGAHDPRSSAASLALATDYHRIDVEDVSHTTPALRASSGAPDHVYRWTSASPAHHGRSHDPRRVYVRADPSTAAVAPDGPGTALVGTDGAFAELNRSRPPADDDASAVFTVSPQVHDRDEEAIVDNLFGLRVVLDSARELYPRHRVGIGLLELTPHFNPAAGDLEQNRAIRPDDARQATTFALCWALAALCEAAAGGAEFVTLFDASGAHGWELDGLLAPSAHLLFDLAEGGFTHAAASPPAVEVCRPPADLASHRRYLMRRPTAPRAVIAANLGPDSWEADAGSLGGSEGLTAGGCAEPRAAISGWLARTIGGDREPQAPKDFHSFRRRAVRNVSADTRLTLPPRSYLFLKESG